MAAVQATGKDARRRRLTPNRPCGIAPPEGVRPGAGSRQRNLGIPVPVRRVVGVAALAGGSLYLLRLETPLGVWTLVFTPGRFRRLRKLLASPPVGERLRCGKGPGAPPAGGRT